MYNTYYHIILYYYIVLYCISIPLHIMDYKGFKRFFWSKKLAHSSSFRMAAQLYKTATGRLFHAGHIGTLFFFFPRSFSFSLTISLFLIFFGFYTTLAFSPFISSLISLSLQGYQRFCFPFNNVKYSAYLSILSKILFFISISLQLSIKFYLKFS